MLTPEQRAAIKAPPTLSAVERLALTNPGQAAPVRPEIGANCAACALFSITSWTGRGMQVRAPRGFCRKARAIYRAAADAGVFRPYEASACTFFEEGCPDGAPVPLEAL